MRSDHRPDIWASAMHDVKDTTWQTCFTYDLAKHVSRHGRKLTGLRDGRISDRDGRRYFPAQQIKRKIPRRYEPSDAAWLSQRIIEGDVVRDMRFGFRVQNRRSKEAEITGGARKLFQIAFDQVRDTQQKFRSLHCGFFRPINKRLFCGRRSGVYVACVAIGDMRIWFSGRRLDIVEVLPAGWLCELAVDEILNLR